MFHLFVSKRYFFSQRDSRFISFITYISITGIALGVAALIIAISILAGFEKEIKYKVAGLVSHIQIQSFKPEGISGYYEAVNILLDSIPDITGASPFYQREAVLRFKDNVDGIVIKGIVPETDLSSAKYRIKSGEFKFKHNDSAYNGILIGDKLASKLNIGIGSKVFVFGIQGIPSPLNSPKIKQFIVTGIYETGLRDYDDIIVYTHLKSAQELFETGNYVTGIELNIKDIDNVENVVNKIKSVLGYPFYPRSLYKLYKGLFTWVELQKSPTPIILGLIIIVATFNIIGTLLMLVLEKTQSIGVLKSLGASNGDIMKIFLFNGMIIGIVGIIIGIIIGVGLSLAEKYYQFFKLPDIYYMKSVPILIQPEYIILVTFITLFLVFISTLIPSYLASRFDPVKSMNFK